MLPVIFGVSVVIFLLMQLAPGDAATALLGPQATEAAKVELRHALGLDQPLPVQYWLGCGARCAATSAPRSRRNCRSIDPGAAALRQHADAHRRSLLLAMVIGYGVGLFAALRAHSLFDRATMTATLLAGSAPPFWLGLDPRSALRHPTALAAGLRHAWTWPGNGGALDVLRHLVLPAVTTALGPAAIITRMVAQIVDEALDRPHVRVARAKGLSRGRRSCADTSS